METFYNKMRMTRLSFGFRTQVAVWTVCRQCSLRMHFHFVKQSYYSVLKYYVLKLKMDTRKLIIVKFYLFLKYYRH